MSTHCAYLNCYWKLFPTSAVQTALTDRVLRSTNHISIYINVCIELYGSSGTSERLICKSDVFYNNFNYAAKGYVGGNSISQFPFKHILFKAA
jgi:hypothetical protein